MTTDGTTVPSTQSDNRVLYSILILAVYAVGQFGSDWLQPLYAPLLADLPSYLRAVIYSATYFGLVPLLGTLLIFGRRGYFARLGLTASATTGFGYAFLMTLPMLLGYAWLSEFTLNIEWGRDFWFGTVAAPLFEEIFFRAFLFGLLYRYGGWGLWPATLLDGFVFGIVHIGQGDSFGEAAGVFAVTAAGAVGFSVLYKEWDWNLWLVIFLHALMNFYWMAFDVADNAAGGTWANVFRGLTVALAIGLTVWRKRAERKALVTADAGALS